MPNTKNVIQHRHSKTAKARPTSKALTPAFPPSARLFNPVSTPAISAFPDLQDTAVLGAPGRFRQALLSEAPRNLTAELPLSLLQPSPTSRCVPSPSAPPFSPLSLSSLHRTPLATLRASLLPSRASSAFALAHRTGSS